MRPWIISMTCKLGRCLCMDELQDRIIDPLIASPMKGNIKGANPYDFVNFLDRFKVGGRE